MNLMLNVMFMYSWFQNIKTVVGGSQSNKIKLENKWT